jgi:hypothetical protein
MSALRRRFAGRSERGSQTTEYALLIVVSATIASLALAWARKGAIAALLDLMMKQVRALFGIGRAAGPGRARGAGGSAPPSAHCRQTHSQPSRAGHLGRRGAALPRGRRPSARGGGRSPPDSSVVR